MAKPAAKSQARVVLVTGASRGIGRAIAETLAGAGFAVALVARPHRGRPDRLDGIVNEIELAGGRAIAVRADLRESAQVEAMVAKVLERLGRIDVLVNNAGVFGGELGLTEVAPVIWRKILDTNLTAAFLCARAVLPTMRAQRTGIIINISSGAAVRTGFLNVAYGVSKAGLDRLTLGIADEFRAEGIHCISLSPPATMTETTARLYTEEALAQWPGPGLTARALQLLLSEADLAARSGTVLGVREYLRSRGEI
jgi:3-oxoacyl-[acyl-carrier protein] reductase